MSGLNFVTSVAGDPEAALTVFTWKNLNETGF